MDSLTRDRNKEIISTYHLIANRYDISKMPMRIVIEMVCNSPASRFYMSEGRAARYIKMAESGNLRLTGNKRRMFDDFYTVYLRQKERLRGYYKYHVISFCLHQQAPSFYLSYAQILKIISEG